MVEKKQGEKEKMFTKYFYFHCKLLITQLKFPTYFTFSKSIKFSGVLVH